MRTNKLKRFLSGLLAVLMVLTLLPTSAWAYPTTHPNTHTNTGDQREDIVQVALTQVGYTEGSNNDTKYGAWYGLNNQPWCAMFVSWCANQAGIPESIVPKFASCTYGGKSFFTANGQWHDSSYTPQRGDLIFFEWGSDNEPDHVGIVEYVSGGYIHTIEGNTSANKVQQRTWSASNSQICGFATPAYNGGGSGSSSTLSLSGATYPWSLKQGSSFSISGTISSSYVINYACVVVLDTEGNDVLIKQVAPGTYSYNIHNMDNDIRFGTLSPGTYYFQVEAQDAAGNFEVLCYERFYVYNDWGSDFYGYLINLKAGNYLENRNNNVQIASGNNGKDPRQIWRFTQQSDGSYKIMNCYNNMMLDVENSRGENGTNVQVCTDNGEKAQRWFVMNYGDGAFLASACNDKVLDVLNGDTTGGTNVQMYQRNNSAAQLFDLHNMNREGATYIKPNKPDAVSIQVSPGNSTQKTTISWSSSVLKGDYDQRTYDVRIWSGSSTNGTPDYSVFDLTGTSYSLQLPLGSYIVQVTAVNERYYEYYTSSQKSFTVENPPATYTVTYYANGGSGAPASQTKTHNQTLYLSSVTPTRSGYSFQGWATSSTATSPQYQPGAAYTGNANLTLYAVWKAVHTHSYTAVVTAPTCTEQGYTTHTCSCGARYVDSYVSALGHSYQNGVCIRCGQRDPNYIAAPVIRSSVVSSSGAIRLTWPAVDGAAKYYIYRCTDGTSYQYYDSITGTTYTNTSVTPGIKYYYRVKTVTSGGSVSDYSNSVSRTADCAKPSISSSIVSSSGAIKLTWNRVEGAVKYYIYRSSDGGETYSYYTSATSTSWTNKSVTPGTKYYYKIKAICSNTEGNSAYSNIVYRTADCAKPSLSSSVVSSSGAIKLTWNRVEGAVKYYIYRSSDGGETYSYYTSTTSTSWTNKNVTPGKTYYYKIKAICSNTEGNSAYSNVVSRTADCAKPVVTIQLNGGKPQLKWSAVDGASKYYIYRSTDGGKTYSCFTTVTATSWTNKSAKSGTTYYYKVVAVCAKSSYGNSAYSNIVSIKSK